MNKDYYTKKEVDKLLAIQKAEIINMLTQSKSSQISAFNFYSPVGRFNKFRFIELLRNELISENLIKLIDKDVFDKVFMGREIVVSSNPSIIEWIGQKNLCPYLIDCLKEFDFLDGTELNKKSQEIFGIKNSAELRFKYNKSKSKLPSNYSVVDRVIIKLNDLANLIERESEDVESFVKNEVIPFIKPEDNLDFPTSSKDITSFS